MAIRPHSHCEVELYAKPYRDRSIGKLQESMIRDRWRLDIPRWQPSCLVDFIIETYDWAGGFIENNDSADDACDIGLGIVHFLGWSDRRLSRETRYGRPSSINAV
jgi:hypothetical protein